MSKVFKMLNIFLFSGAMEKLIEIETAIAKLNFEEDIVVIRWKKKKY